MKQQPITKSEISKRFAALRRAGFKVLNFNSNRAFGTAMKDMPDHFICGHGWIFFVEDKLGRDVFSDGQKEMKKEIENVAGRVMYYVCDGENIGEIIKEILELMGTKKR